MSRRKIANWLAAKIASVRGVLRKFTKPIIAVGGISVVAASCATNAPQDTWQPKGPNSKLIDDLQQPVFAVAGIIGLIVADAVIYTMIKYRDRGQRLAKIGRSLWVWSNYDAIAPNHRLGVGRQDQYSPILEIH